MSIQTDKKINEWVAYGKLIRIFGEIIELINKDGNYWYRWVRANR